MREAHCLVCSGDMFCRSSASDSRVTASRRLVIVVGLLAAAGALAAWLWQVRSDDALRARVEALGPALAGVTLGIESARLRGDALTLQGFTLSNPSEYRSPYALRIETLSLRFKANSLGAMPWRLSIVDADGLQAIFETQNGTSNLEEILDRVEAYSRQAERADPWASAAVAIEELRAGPGRVRVQLEGEARIREAEMPAIALELRESESIAAGVLASEALAILIRRAITAGAEVVLRDLVQQTRPAGMEGLQQAGDNVAEALEQSGRRVTP